ncbi:STAS domain-containing protein [Bacillus massilinigeriensis]|uniref:STAS domain-containing protein n=1 Tax=Bacillus mediterraneensis TaxID=1805474 RepID=UPI0008F90054|nr:STAS domain-containing protein [Bacillus mediterraneensis]
MQRTKELTEYLLENAEILTEQWLDLREENQSTYGKEAPIEVEEDIKEQNMKLIQTVAHALLGESDYKEWAFETSTRRAKMNTPLEEVLRSFKLFRETYWSYIVKFAIETGGDTIELGNWGERINFIFDDIIEVFCAHYQKVHEENVRAQKEMMLEMSSPVIPVYSNVGILPLVGDIDTYRAKIIREKTLLQVSNLKLEHLIVDLSGVPIIDTMVAHELFQIIKALSLLGVQAAITGISPAIAQTSVNLGLDFSGIATYSSLQQALLFYIRT